MFREGISQHKAQKIRKMAPTELRSEVDVNIGTGRPINRQGIEVELDWENPESLNIPHFWLDPKIRRNKIGQTVLDEIIKQAKDIPSIEKIFITIENSSNTDKFLARMGFNTRKYEHEYWGQVVEGELSITE